MTTTPTPTPFSQYQQNVRRQSREQKAVGSLLSGVAISLLVVILFVAGLAGYGGWFLWKQIQNQSATVGDLEVKLVREVVDLRKKNHDNVDAINVLTDRDADKKQQIVSLQSQLADALSQIRKDRAANQTKFQKLENRVYDVEREVQTR